MKLEKENYFTDDCIVEDQLYLALKDLITCPICHKILKNPYMCTKCQTTYCKKCLEDYSSLKKCLNHEEEVQFKHSIMKSEMLSKLKYKCKNCKKEVIQDEIKAHLEDNCQYIEEEKEKTLAEIIQTKKELIKLSREEMKNKIVDNSFASNIFFIIKIFFINIVITLGDSGVGKSSLLQR